MGDINIAFCRLMLAQLRADMKRAKTKSPRNYWTYHFGRGHWEFQIRGKPDVEFYWHGHADNGFDARYKGIRAWLKDKDPAGYARIEALIDESTGK